MPLLAAVKYRETKPVQIRCTNLPEEPIRPGATLLQARGPCLVLRKTGGPDFFFTDQQSGCTVVVTTRLNQTTNEQEVIVAHVYADNGEDITGFTPATLPSDFAFSYRTHMQVRHRNQRVSAAWQACLCLCLCPCASAWSRA